MIIKGPTVGTPMPRTNYEQTNPAKADYLKGKTVLDEKIQDAQTAADNAQTAADNAQTAADNAQTAADNAQAAADNANATADNALPKDGGTMTGSVAMGGNKVTDLGTPTDDGDATSKKYVDDKTKLFTVVLTVNDWEGDKAPYKQIIGIEGILGTDRPHYGPVYSEDTTTMLAEKEAFGYVDDLDTADGSVTFTCFEDKPETNVTVQMEVHR